MPTPLQRFKANIFQAMAHPTRVSIVELLRDGEITVGTVISRLGLDQANASQHLAILRTNNIVTSRRDRNNIYYAVRDPSMIEVLDVLKRYFNELTTDTPESSQELSGVVELPEAEGSIPPIPTSKRAA